MVRLALAIWASLLVLSPTTAQAVDSSTSQPPAFDQRLTKSTVSETSTTTELRATASESERSAGSDWDAVIAVGTIGLAVFTGWLAWETRNLARQALKESRDVKKEIELSQKQADEATRARIDAQAPRLAITAQNDFGRTSLTNDYRGYLDNDTILSLEAPSTLIWFNAKVRIANEGTSSAWFDFGVTNRPLRYDFRRYETGISKTTKVQNRWLLKPSATVDFDFWWGVSIDVLSAEQALKGIDPTWAGVMPLTIFSTDQFEQGISDTTNVYLRGIVTSPTAQGQVAIQKNFSLVIDIRPTERSYRNVTL